MIRKFFGDAERDFALGSKMIHELERVTDTGIGDLYRLLAAHSYGLSHIAHTIRLALIGGGTPPQEADALVRVYVATDGNPLIEAYALALDILDNLLTGAKPANKEQDSNEPA